MEYLPLFLLFAAALIAGWFYLQRAKNRGTVATTTADRPVETVRTTETTDRPVETSTNRSPTDPVP